METQHCHRKPHLHFAGILTTVICLAALHTTNINAPELFLLSKYKADQLYKSQKDLINNLQSNDIKTKLQGVNDFFNREITLKSDQQAWGESDYWATPLETLDHHAGDIEDLVIAKYFTLLKLGESSSKLRLVYVNINNQDRPAEGHQHMILAYYATPTTEPLILDNRNPEILPASQRPDLIPIFSFNSKDPHLQTIKNSSDPALSRWENLLKRTYGEIDK